MNNRLSTTHDSEFFDKQYFEAGPQAGKSLYQNYRWMPELTIPLAHHIVKYMNIQKYESVLDFGCAKGYLVYALRLLGYDAYGVDVSEYALNSCQHEVEDYLELIKPLDDRYKYHEHIICKDILEHIPYDSIDEQMKILANKCEKLFAIIPLGDGEKYYIDAYELDKSHYIREDVDWWEERFRANGFHNIEVSTDLGPFKANWQDINDRGNALIIGS